MIVSALSSVEVYLLTRSTKRGWFPLFQNNGDSGESKMVKGLVSLVTDFFALS